MNWPGYYNYPQLDRRDDCWHDEPPSARFFWFALAGGVALAAAALAWLGLVWLLLTWLPSTL